MQFILGLILTVAGCLLGTYYYLKANDDKFNRPSFFNSKARKWSLVIVALVLFAAGEYLGVIIAGYNYIWVTLLVYFTIYSLAKDAWRQNVIISRVFKDYLTLRNPSVGLSKKEQLIAPIEFSLLRTHMDKTRVAKARRYLEARIDSGKIRSAKDLPQELITIIKTIDQAEIEKDIQNKLPQSRIDYLYEEIIENKPHDDYKKRLSSLFWSAEASFERLFKNFAFISLPRPDFTSQEIQLVAADVFSRETKTENGEKIIAVFTNIPARAAKKFGWVHGTEEYLALAALEFSRRYPEHQFSKGIKKQHKFTKQQIFDYAQNWENLDVSRIRVA